MQDLPYTYNVFPVYIVLCYIHKIYSSHTHLSEQSSMLCLIVQHVAWWGTKACRNIHESKEKTACRPFAVPQGHLSGSTRMCKLTADLPITQCPAVRFMLCFCPVCLVFKYSQGFSTLLLAQQENRQSTNSYVASIESIILNLLAILMCSFSVAVSNF